MKVFIFVILILSAAALFGQDCDLLTDENKHWPAPDLDKPGYLETVIDPTFDTKITRIVGDPGDAVPGISGEVWPDEQERHGYSKRQPWNCDQSMIYLNRLYLHSGKLFLDGETYEPLFTRDTPSGRLRWSHSEPNIMYYITDSKIGKWDVVNDQTETILSYSGYSSCSFGEGEGNFTNDDKYVAVLAEKSGHQVIFIADIEAKSKGSDIDPGGDVSNCTMSSYGTYLIATGDFGNGSDRIRVFDASNGNILWTGTEYGRPSHWDTQIDQNGDEVIVGTDKSDKGSIIKRRISDGEITKLISGYAAHTSGRALNRSGWAFVTYQNNSSTSYTYLNELVAVKLDGTRHERICHIHSNNFTYVAEAHGVPSPDGLRMMFASDWDSEDYPVQAYVVDFRDKKISGQQYTLTTSTNGSGSVSLSPSGGTYDEGTEVTVTATAASGWTFDHWSGDASGSTNPITVIMNSDKNITANFVENSGGGTGIVDAQVSAGNDDAEEKENGSMSLSSSDLELVRDGSAGDQTVGMRFNGIDIPQGANITAAYVQFTVDEDKNTDGSLTIRGEAADDAAAFTSSSNNISNRSTTSASVNWTPPEWTNVGESGSDQRTPDISSIVQEIVNRGGWSSGNSLAIIITGTGTRTAESYDGSSSDAPKIHIEYSDQTTEQYTLTTNTNGSGSVSLSPSGGTYDEGTEVTVTATAASGWTFDHWSGDASGSTNPITVTMNSDKSITANFVENGGGGSAEVVDAQVSTGNDDAEEKESGSMSLNSSDLELVHDGSRGDQTVGMRFNGINIPQGANITAAYVQFTVDEDKNADGSFTIRGEDADDAATFTTSSNNISNRSTTSASVNWAPPEWTNVGESGSDQRTPDISSIVQEIVNRGGWSSGNSMAIIITGTGTRTAESYDGSSSDAPKLHIEYTTSASKSVVQNDDINNNIVPDEYALSNYPNPFNPTTTIRFDLPTSGNVKISIYDISGKEVASIVDGYYEKGRYQIVWQALDNNNRKVASGMYIAKIQSGSYVKCIKMLLMQ